MESSCQYSTIHKSACKLIEEQALWGQKDCRVWLPNQERLIGDHATIIAVAEKIPNNVLEEDPKLLMWYDQEITRMGGE